MIRSNLEFIGIKRRFTTVDVMESDIAQNVVINESRRGKAPEYICKIYIESKKEIPGMQYIGYLVIQNRQLTADISIRYYTHNYNGGYFKQLQNIVLTNIHSSLSTNE